LGKHAFEAMQHTNRIIEQHSPGHQEKLAAVFPNGGQPPTRTMTADELMQILAYQSELLGSLADIVDRLAKEAGPKKQGRPRRDAA